MSRAALGDSPRTTVIVLNWNGKDLLEECFESLRAQTDQDFQAWMVDNGSEDDSLAFMKQRFPEVRLIALPENYGFAKGNNVAMAMARTPRVALLNNDTRADPRWLEALNAELDRHPEAGFCASKLLNYYRPDELDTAGDQLGVAYAVKRGHGEKDGPEYGEAGYVFGACAGAAMYRREMLDRVGLFDEDFGTNFEDVDLSFRAQVAGYRCRYAPDAIVLHKVGETKRRSGWTKRASYRNAKIAWFKSAPPRLLLRHAPRYAKYELLRMLVCTGLRRRGFEAPELDRLLMLMVSHYDMLRALPRTLEKRREVQSQRVVNADYIQSMMHFW